MDNEIDKKLALILESNQEILDEASPLELFQGVLDKSKEGLNKSKGIFDKYIIEFFSSDIAVKIISKIILSNPELLQKITNSVLDNIHIKVSKKQ